MDIPNENIDLIEQWLNGDLTENQEIALQEKYQNDLQFQNQVKETQELINGIKMYNEQELRLKLSGIENKLESEGFFAPREPKIKRLFGFSRQWMAIAASMMLLLLGYLYTDKVNIDRGKTDIYVALIPKHLDDDLDRLESIGFASENSDDPALYNSLELIEKQKYSEAILSLNEQIQLGENNSYAYHYLGIAYYLKGQYQNALTSLKQSLDEDTPHNQIEAKFYMALVLSKIDGQIDKKKIQSLLAEVKGNTDSAYYNEANELLKLIK